MDHFSGLISHILCHSLAPDDGEPTAPVYNLMIFHPINRKARNSVEKSWCNILLKLLLDFQWQFKFWLQMKVSVRTATWVNWLCFLFPNLETTLWGDINVLRLMLSGLRQWYCWILNTTWYKSKWWVGQCRHKGAMWCWISAPLHHLCNYLMCDVHSLAPKWSCLRTPNTRCPSGCLTSVWQPVQQKLWETAFFDFVPWCLSEFSRGNGLSWHKRKLSKPGCVSISHY